jgi:hypothetical protein
LVFLDDKLLGATSNAVERANRRFRKAQKSIYSVRTKAHVEQRLALDMQREQRPRAPTDRENAPSGSLQAHLTALTLLQCLFFQDFPATRRGGEPRRRAGGQLTVVSAPG